jgi:hypothetical protein
MLMIFVAVMALQCSPILAAPDEPLSLSFASRYHESHVARLSPGKRSMGWLSCFILKR